MTSILSFLIQNGVCTRHIFLETLQDSMVNIKEPFLRVALTLSSHEPFEIPMEPVLKAKMK